MSGSRFGIRPKRRKFGEGLHDPCVTTDIKSLITALYVKIDDQLTRPRWRGRLPLLTDPELISLAEDSDFWFDNAAIWHNNETGAPTTTSLIAYGH